MKSKAAGREEEKMKKRFIGLSLLCCALLVGCAAGVCADGPAISESVPAAESHAVDSSPEKAPVNQPAGNKREDLLPEKKPVVVQKDDAAKQEENLTEEEKAQLRFERGEKFALGGDVGSFVGSAAYVHTADGAPLRWYDGHKEMQEDGLELWTFSSYDSAVEADKKGFVLVMNERVPQDAFYYNRSEIYCAEWAEMSNLMGEIIKEVAPEVTMHCFRMVGGAKQKNLVFDLMVPYDSEITNQGLKKEIDAKLAARNKKYGTVIRFDGKE
jgi:hypothetical protein